jgi:putative copper resistance protein D
MDQALLICRFLQFSAAMVLFGGSAFNGLMVPRGLGDRPTFLRRTAEPGLAILVALTTLAWLGLQAGEAGEGWPDTINADVLWSVLTATNFGQVWVGRLILVAVLLAILGLRPARRRWPMLAVSAALLASLGLIGHSAMQQGAIGWGHKLNHALHLLAAGFWVGCLPSLLACLGGFNEAASSGAVIATLKRFSGVGHLAVALVLATGIINTALILERPWLDLSSPYQQLLVLKVGLVAVMVVIAVVNRYLIVPRLANKGPGALRALVAGTIAELALGAVAIGLVSAFAAFDPL